MHANYVAFARTIELSERAGVDGFVLMGDYACDFANPQKTFDLVAGLREKHPTWSIRGNRDEYMLDHRAGKFPGWRDGSASGSLLYTYESLREKDFAFLESLSSCLEIRIDGHEPLTVCHASPFLSREMMIDNDERISECLEAVSTDKLFLGHTHRIRTFRAGGKVANFCGSVGIPDGYGGMTQFAILDDRSGAWEIVHMMAEYDVERAIADMDASGLTARAGMWAQAVKIIARTGENVFEALNRTAREMAHTAGLDATGVIPEEFYEDAARRIGIA